jgi:glycosyltransferase involved in cell wall biosynthesis
MDNLRQTVVMFSTADWKDRYWTNKQHTAAGLAARGYRVLYVESVGIRRPGVNALDLRRIGTRLRDGLRPVREVSENVWVLSPLTIPFGHRFALVGWFNRWQLRSRIKRWLRGRGALRPMIWTYHPYMLDAATDLDPSALIYHSVDDLGSVPGVDHAAYYAAEARLLEAADHVFVTSRALFDHCVTTAGARTHYFNNVADIDHFGAARKAGPLPAELEAIPRPRLIYVGALSDFKLDLKMIAAVAERRPDWHLVFIGAEREGQHSPEIEQLARRPNAHFLGWRAYSDLPGYLRGADVALLPQQINDYTRSMFPMKFFEYLAAGLPVVSTALPALSEYAALHRVACSTEEFIGAIGQALRSPSAGVLPLNHPILRANSYDARLDAMLAIVGPQAAGG